MRHYLRIFCLAFAITGCEEAIDLAQLVAPGLGEVSAAADDRQVELTGTVSNTVNISECGFYFGTDVKEMRRYTAIPHEGGTFSALIEGLASATVYFYRAFLSNGRYEIYSDLGTISTPKDNPPVDPPADPPTDPEDPPVEPDVPDGTVDISATFPDPVLQAYVRQKFDDNSDGFITQEELALATTINIESAEIQSLEGIRHLPNLRKLTVTGESFEGGGKITSADLSGNPSLTQVNISFNRIETVNLGGCSSITSLNLNGNRLESIDLSELASLQKLRVDDNLLTNLDVRKNPALADLRCCGNNITSLDLGANAALATLYCYGNLIKTLNLLGNPVLHMIKCNPMESLESIYLIKNHGYDKDIPLTTTIIYN